MPISLAQEITTVWQNAEEEIIRIGSALPVAGTLAQKLDETISQRLAAHLGDDTLLCALGSWARLELCPYSDFDFLILTKSTTALSPQAVEEMLSPLWAAGLKIGYSIRTPNDLAVLAKTDIATATSLLDARPIAGDPQILSETKRLFQQTVSISTIGEQMSASVSERRERYGKTVYRLEPNLKFGIGGLRDAAVVQWCSELLGSRSSQWGGEMAKRFSIARERVHLLRTLLQLWTKRGTDRLTFEEQERLGTALFPNAMEEVNDTNIRHSVAPAVEKLMRSYFMAAKDIAVSADLALETCVNTGLVKTPQFAQLEGAFLVTQDAVRIDPSVSNTRFMESPKLVMEAFQLALKRKVPLDHQSRNRLRNFVAEAPLLIRDSEDIRRLFLDCLCDITDTAHPSILEQIHEIGLLGVLLPPFVACSGRVQHDLYHVFTVDQHSLLTVTFAKKVLNGELAESHPQATEVARQLESPMSLLFACLMHDAGKPFGKGHSETGGQLVEQWGPRLGLPDSVTEEAAFLVRQHLVMSHISQRRDLNDPKVIQRFAEKMGSTSRLRNLALLTLADSEMTSPGNFSDWKRSLLWELYSSANTALGGTLVPKNTAAVREKLAGQFPQHAGRIHQLPQKLLESNSIFTLGQVLETLSLRETNTAALHGWRIDEQEFSQVCITMQDTPGALAKITGVFAANGIEVMEAQIGTFSRSENRDLLDLFHVRKGGQSIPTESRIWTTLLEQLTDPTLDMDSLRKNVDARRASRLDPKNPRVPNEVVIYSEEEHIVEVHTEDKLGLLFTLTRLLSHFGADILFSKVSTQGNKATDVFYISLENFSLAEQDRLRKVLLDGLEEFHGAC